jgi:hypothetical protein
MRAIADIELDRRPIKALWDALALGTDEAAFIKVDIQLSDLTREWAEARAAQGPSPREIRRINMENRGWRD